MEWLEKIGFAGFMFFLIKGLVWIGLFLLVYFGVIDKERMNKIKEKISFFKKKKSKTD